MSSEAFYKVLSQNYRSYHVNGITVNRFPYEELMDVLLPLADRAGATREELGKSTEGRTIYGFSLGSGPVKVLLWSQMHGNESTATRALLDVLEFFSHTDHQKYRDEILGKVTIKMLPMLNPDGSNRFQRRTSLGIDMNRDALVLQSPESRILKGLVDTFKPDFGYNLHDQHRFYNVKGTGVPSTISFLAPAFNVRQDMNEQRQRAMQVIAGMNDVLQNDIPGGVGIYTDLFYPRAFGDNIARWGTSTILIESGWTHNDMEKEYVRELNFKIILSSLYDIAIGSYKERAVVEYQNIPMLDDKFMDVLIKDVEISAGVQADIGVRREEITDTTTYEYHSKGTVADIGDLSPNYGFEVVESAGLKAVPGRVYAAELEQFSDLEKLDLLGLLRTGVLYVKCKSLPDSAPVPMAMNVVPSTFEAPSLSFEGLANFLLVDQEEKVRYAVLNGFLIDLEQPQLDDVNGLVV